MSVSMEVQVGKIKVTVKGETVEQAFQNAAVVSAFPVAGPGGEQDLQMRYRKGATADGKKYEYYSIVSESAGMEFKLGQRQDGGLFPKGWEPLYVAEGAENGNVGGTIGVQPQVGIQPQVQAAPVQAAPVQAAPAQVQAQAAPTIQPQSVAQPTQPAATPAQQQNASQANSVLAKYGIGGAQ